MIRVLDGDMRDVVPTLDRLDCCVTDPPYELNFMGRAWDRSGVAFDPATWWPVFTALKPGAFLVAFASARGYHRMVCAIEDAGFLIHPMIGWITGQGFPKATRFEQPELAGWRYGLQALKPALEPICLAQKPMEGTGSQNWAKHGVGGLNVDACRVSMLDGDQKGRGGPNAGSSGTKFFGNMATSGNNRDGLGRWPANVLHDGSDEVLEAFAAYGESKSSAHTRHNRPDGGNVPFTTAPSGVRVSGGIADTGSAARFFFSSKAGKADRADSKHPTVKPVDLMRWLVRLVCPPGGTVLDPFAGSGSTGEAAMLEGMNAILVERDRQHCADIRHRIRRWSGEDSPLFATAAD